MTPKEKANELANRFIFKSVFEMTDDELIKSRSNAKQCALIAVDEILSLIWWSNRSQEYWKEVRNEIEKL